MPMPVRRDIWANCAVGNSPESLVAGKYADRFSQHQRGLTWEEMHRLRWYSRSRFRCQRWVGSRGPQVNKQLVLLKSAVQSSEARTRIRMVSCQGKNSLQPN